MSAIIKRFCSMLSRAKRSEDGSVLIIFALSAMVLLGTLAMSLDFGLAYSEHDRLQKATDAAALAAATMLDGTDAEREARGTNVFKANYKENAASNFTIKIENGSGASRVVHANVKRSLQTHILPLFGYPKLDLNAETRSPIPRLLDEQTDALTAMGQSMALVWNNLPVMLYWGAIVVGLFALSVVTLFAGLIVVFPVLGHATWHAYSQMREPGGTGAERSAPPRATAR